MASIQLRKGGFYRIAFRYLGKQRVVILGKVSERQALARKTDAEEWLDLLERRKASIPDGVTVEDFIRFNGNPPIEPEFQIRKDTTLQQLREEYEAAYSNGAIEPNTLYTIRLHLDRIAETLGKRFLLSGLTLGKMQGHIERRIKKVTPVTIKKEIDSFRSVWNYGVRARLVQGTFPSHGLVYPKTTDKLPFLSWKEIEQRIKKGGDPDELWECLYLDGKQIAELLTFANAKKAPAWVHPMLATAAMTGMRRSELIRCRVEDIDLAGKVITVREKKRAKGKVTNRRVPISSQLAAIMEPYLAERHDTLYAFGNGQQMLSVQATQKAINRLLAKSKWSVCAKWHLFRHSFISICASKGVDARMLQAWVGHQTAEMARRYTHLFPNVQDAAIASVFA